MCIHDCAGGARHSQRGFRPAGFTLIELLVVIGIIAVLAAIVIPVYARAQERSRQAVCISNMHTIVLAMRIYQQDYQAYPQAYNLETGTGGITALYPDYITDVKSLRCPNDLVRDAAAYVELYAGLVPDDPPGRRDDFLARWDRDLNPGFFTEHYSSYNQDTSLALGDSGNPDTTGDGVPDVSFILYNYYGYDETGHQKLTSANDPPLPSANFRGVKYPRLMNRFAPDETMISHCPYHRDYFRGYTAATAQDVIVRLGGSAEMQQVHTRPPQEYWIDQRPR